VADDPETPLGAFIRSQRELHAMSVRQLAELSGISNPYLSQIERGLRDPSEQVLDAIAQQLELSADALKQHGARDTEDEDSEPAVVTAIREDSSLTARQRKALLEVYYAFSGRDPRPRR
jgi:transcriptional regulator with XRE-family HTH domain